MLGACSAFRQNSMPRMDSFDQFRRHIFKKRGDHFRIFLRDGWRCPVGQMADRIDIILLHEQPVKLHLDLRVADPAVLDHFLHIRVALAVQREMADKPVNIRPRRRGIRRPGDHVRRMAEKSVRRPVMERIPLTG